MNVERLLLTADLLAKVPAKVFKLVDWVHPKGYGSESFTGNFDCGFAGCAIGWVAHAKIIPGLKIVGSVPSYREADGGVELISWEAVRAAYDINRPQAQYLFSSLRYGADKSPKVVEARIRDFVANPIDFPRNIPGI